jgi:ElaB/YqjD/DUF883 family membrane-anchored ribosome-binding protein
MTSQPGSESAIIDKIKNYFLYCQTPSPKNIRSHTLPAQSWWDNNPRRTNESFVAFVTRVQDAVATTGREAIANTANHVKEEEEPPWTDRTGMGIAAQPALNPKGVAPQRPHESIAAFVTRVQIAVSRTSREAISHTKKYVKEEDNPLCKG